MSKVKLNAKFAKTMMAKQGIDQQTLAELSGVSEPTISRLMNGKAFTSDTLGKLARALGCSPVDLIDPSGFVAPHVDAPTPQHQLA